MKTADNVIATLAAAGYTAYIGDGEDYLQTEHGRERIGFDVEGFATGNQALAETVTEALVSAGYDAEAGDASNEADWPVYVVCKALMAALNRAATRSSMLAYLPMDLP